MVLVPLATSSAHRKNRSFGLGNSTTPTFADYDADADGLISAEEIAAVKAAEAEAKAAAKAAAAEAKAAEEAATLAEFDADGDGVWNEEEAAAAAAAEEAAETAEDEAKAAEKAAAAAALLAEYDADENGVLDIVEQARAKAAASIASAEEILAALTVRFDEIDTDADGEITLAEMQFALPLESLERLYNTLLSYDTDLSLTISTIEFTSKPVSNGRGKGKGRKSKRSKRGRH